MINKDNVGNYAWIGDEYVKEIKALVLNFHGLGFGNMKQGTDSTELELAASGALCITPYYGPWSWMNRQAIALVDMVIDAIIEKYNLDDSIPIISTGGSMGGLSSLIYTRYAKRTPVACAANCPVCDLPFHSTERPDLPRTMYSAFAHYECTVDEAMMLHSPIHQVENMPHIPYLIIHGDMDKSVDKKKHSDAFVSLMKSENHDIYYVEATRMGHCAFNSYEIYRKYMEFVKQYVK